MSGGSVVGRRPMRMRRGERAQAMVEFALVGPLLFILAFGVFDFGKGMSANVTVTNSSREGARYLVVNAIAKGSAQNYGSACYGTGGTAPSTDSAQGKAWRQLQNASLDLTSVTMSVRFYQSTKDPATNAADLTITCSSGSPVVTGTYTPSPGDWVQFEVDYGYAPSTPFISSIVHQISMSRTTTMVLE